MGFFNGTVEYGTREGGVFMKLEPTTSAEIVNEFGIKLGAMDITNETTVCDGILSRVIPTPLTYH